MIRAATLDVALSLRHEDFELLKSIVRNFVPLSSVIIYGSRCNGTARDTSDIDLLILDSSITQLNVSELREHLDESNIGPRVDLHTVADLPDSWIQGILATGVRLDSAVASGG
jgi:predicted nucleotidyltransferase